MNINDRRLAEARRTDDKTVFTWGRYITCAIVGHKPVTETRPGSEPMWFDTYCVRCLKTPLWGGWVHTNVRGFS